jgi:mRNA interferase YafQ
MLSVKTTKKLESDFKRMVRAGSDPALFWAIVELLADETTIPEEFRDHELEGEWAGVRDIHIEADWLLLYQISGRDLILVRTGRHEDLF